VNLLTPLPDARAAEQIETLLTRPGLRVERIVSLGQASPPGFWYDQAEGEWVLVLAGAAKLRFADEPEARLLRPGDWLDIAPHRRHRVDWTDWHAKPYMSFVAADIPIQVACPPAALGGDALRLRPARSGAVIRPEPGEWYPRMPER
jgi:cupin 2 domain-containing protein